MRTKKDISEYNKVYRSNNKEYFVTKNKEYHDNNKEQISEKKKDYYCKNRERIIERKKKYYIENKERLNKKSVARVNERKSNDELFRLRCNVRGLIHSTIRLKGYRKKSKTIEILGCTFEEFKTYLESKFESWMNWDNYGNWNGQPEKLNISWDIDHIIPASSATSEEELMALNHYSNLQPLCSYENRYNKKNNLILSE